jgi:hypothetical protein
MDFHYLDGEEAMLIDTAPPATCSSPAEDAYFISLHAHYPSRPFRLWDLPRELRDAIYDYALVENASFKVSSRSPSPSEDGAEREATSRPEDALDEAHEETEPQAPAMQATIKHRASTNILLAGQSLKREYEERVENAMKVVLTDTDRFAFQPINLPHQATKVHNFELHLILFCHSCNTMSHFDEKTCHAALELNQHRIWIDKLLPQLTELRSLAVHAYISHDRYRSESKQKIPCERVVLPKFQEMRRSLPQVKNLLLYKYDYNGYPDLDGPKAIVWEWSARDGVVKPAERPAPPTPASEDQDKSMESESEASSA